MRFAILTAIGILVLATSTHGSRKEGVHKRVKQTSPVRKEHLNTLGKKKSLNDILDLDNSNSFETIRTITTKKGSKKCRSKQTYAGLEVFGAGVVYSVDDNEEITGSFSGDIFVGIEEDIADFNACMIDEDHLFIIGKEIAGIPADSVHCHLEITQRIIYVDEYVKANLAYIIDLYDITPNNPSRPYIIIGACDNTTYFNIERIPKEPIRPTAAKTRRSTTRSVEKQPSRQKREPCNEDATGTGGNPKTGDIVYGPDPRCLHVQKSGSTCTLESTKVKVIDLHQTENKPGTTYSYDCSNPDDLVNDAKSADLDAFFYGETIYNVFETIYGMSPLTFQLVLNVHYGYQYENAFWDGSSMTFGDGQNYFYPLVGLDVTAHEIAHGITQQNSDLVYSKQSGGINEAFSDITGEAVECLASFRAEANPPVPNDWMVGAEIIKSANQALRYFEDPTWDGRSIRHINDYTDSMDVHYSSGIYNKAFYELVQNQNVQMEIAYGIFLEANKIYWGSTTGFKDGACGVKAAAADYEIDVAKIDAAFSVVGIDTTDCDTSFETLPETTSDLTVSNTINPCYALLPKIKTRRHVRIQATSVSGEAIKIKIFDEYTGSLLVSRKGSKLYRLPTDGSENIVCFSAGAEVNDVTVTAKYCRRRRDCKA